MMSSEMEHEAASQEKRQVLIAWYGLTDLSAAMGTEGTLGPIASALCAGNYTDAVILAYTKADLSGVDVHEQEEYMELLNSDRDANLKMDRNEVYHMAQRFANTPNGHQFYFSWLRGELAKQEKQVRIIEQECFLKFLNDSNGIYCEALKSIEQVRAEYGTSAEITLFISPGTPVMAFSWAFAALVNSDINLSILVSPDSRKGFETVPLPYQLKDLSLENVNMTHPQHFDVMFHIYGEQPLPPALGIRQFPDTAMHICVGGQGSTSIGRFRFLLDKGQTIQQLDTDPFSPQAVKDDILAQVKAHPEWHSIGFNLTGGTKMMYDGALSACRQCHGVPFYFENKKHQMIWLNDYSTEKMTGLPYVEDFLRLAGMEVSYDGAWDASWNERIALTNALWKNRSAVASLYSAISDYSDRPGIPFDKDRGNGKFHFKLNADGSACATIDGKNYIYKSFPDFASYLTGGWLEEFVYLQLKPLLEDGTITDLRLGLAVSWPREQVDTQEFDVIFTDSKRLYIVECKAGNFRALDVQKLQNNVRNYGGVDGRGVLAACFPPSGESADSIRERFKKALNISMFIGDAISKKMPDEIWDSFGKVISGKLN